MKRFILKTEPDRDGLVRISGGDYHYLVHVRRLAPGGRFPALLDGVPRELEAISTDNGVLVCKMRGEASPPAPDLRSSASPHSGAPPRNAPPLLCKPLYAPCPATPLPAEPPLPPIILFQAMPKGAKIDLIIRQAAEGGLSEVVVFVSEHSVARPGEDEAAHKLERWRRIIREARQQSGSLADTKPRFCPSPEAALSYWADISRAADRSAALLLHEAAGLEQGVFHRYLDNEPALVALAVGPEGGFSGAETGRFREAGFKAVRMGDSVLRTETAALYAAAAARIILLEKTAWTLKKDKITP